MASRVLLTVLLATQGLVSVVECAGFGEVCSPVLPWLFCATDSMVCKQQPEGNYQCECVQGSTSNRAGTACVRTYDETCTVGNIWNPIDVPCNNDRFIQCSDTTPLGYGTCKCTDRTNTVFNEDTQTCVGVSGAPCDPDSDSIWGYNCVAHAHCERGGDTQRCKCDEGYAENDQGKCQRVGGDLGVTCSSNSDCDSSVLHLECNPGSNTCDCGAGYSQDSTGHCWRDHGEKCSSQDRCHTEKHLQCSSHSGFPGTCGCEKPDLYVYDQGKDECVSQIGNTCSLEPNGIGCPSNAECILDMVGGANKYYCECQDGFIATHEKVCRPREAFELGDTCNPSLMECSADSMSLCLAGEDGTYTCKCPGYAQPNKAGTRCYRRWQQSCSEELGLWCNHDRHLECFNNLGCRCALDMAWHEGRGLCVALANSVVQSCTMGNTEFDKQCVDHATCTPDISNNYCACNEGYHQATNRTCIPDVY